MRAIRMDGHGGPEVLKLADVPTPEPGEGQVRIKVAAVGVNPADWKWRAGWFQARMPLSFPHIPGYDLAGVVDKVGPGVTNLAVGARVATTTSATQGAYAEYAIVPAANPALIPDELDFVTAAALPTPAVTGAQLVEEHVKPTAGQLVLVTGAVGAVGRFSLYCALKLGARVVAAVRASQADEARALGAESVIVLGQDDWIGEPFDGVADTIGGPDVARLCLSLKPGAPLCTVSTTPIDPDGLPSTPAFNAVHSDSARLAGLAQAVARGEISMPVARRLPLAQAAEAHRLLEVEKVSGKIVLEV